MIADTPRGPVDEPSISPVDEPLTSESALLADAAAGVAPGDKTMTIE